MFASRWRWNATRALAVRRFAGGRKVPPAIQRMRSDDLLAAVFPDQVACFENLTGPPRIPDHPLVNETIANCLFEAMDLNVFRRLIAGMRDGSIRTIAVETREYPSPTRSSTRTHTPSRRPLEERRAAVQLRQHAGPRSCWPVVDVDPPQSRSRGIMATGARC
jgi:ATP-dependent Lhr-like helicase